MIVLAPYSVRMRHIDGPAMILHISTTLIPESIDCELLDAEKATGRVGFSIDSTDHRGLLSISLPFFQVSLATLKMSTAHISGIQENFALVDCGSSLDVLRVDILESLNSEHLHGPFECTDNAIIFAKVRTVSFHTNHV